MENPNFSVQAGCLENVNKSELLHGLAELLNRASSTIKPEEYETLVLLNKTYSKCYYVLENQFAELS